MDKYNHIEIEAKWREHWKRAKCFEVNISKAANPYYNLMMFPYPSAEGLHVGNFFAFVGSDVHGRYMRARGKDVFEPIGFDAFGIHSENHAIKTGKHPERLVPENIRRFRVQLERMGNMFNWRHEVNSTSPAYYRWTQWLFLQLFRAGLAYRKESPVNWCDSCKTVLADEQAEEGRCERCGTTVRQKNMKQWFLGITKYADRLLKNLDWIDWSRITKTAQKRWIGKSHGAEIFFSVKGRNEKVSVFTTRPDTIRGATYLVMAPEHPMVSRICSEKQRMAVTDYIDGTKAKSRAQRADDRTEKTGIFTGAFAENPASGESIPIWISDYVLMSYGSGAIMAVPAHDKRDFEFAAKFGLPVVEVVSPDGRHHALEEAYEGPGQLVNSGDFNGMQNDIGAKKIVESLSQQGKAKAKTQFRLHDWCVSRQRFWGPPIPIVHCDTCGVVGVPESELPVLLPKVDDFEPDGSGIGPLARNPDFLNTQCPECGRHAKRETDVSDNFLDSAWYFFRYPSAFREDAVFDQKLTQKWLPVDMYIGGNEHAVLHLMYTRFITMVLKDLGFIAFEEPFKRFRAHGLIVKDGAKMSKSKGNVINPDVYLDEYGADVFRTYLMFFGPFLEGGDFRDSTINGIKRFLERVWHYVGQTEFTDAMPDDASFISLLNLKIKETTRDISNLHYNTAISRMMELSNKLTSGAIPYRHTAKILLKLLAPFAPFLTQELWERLGEKGLICDSPWPEYDDSLIKEDMVGMVVQVNGKNRLQVEIPFDTGREDVEFLAFGNHRIEEWIRGKEIVKTVFVKNKLLNVVVRN